MPAQTPSGWRSDQLSMPLPTLSENSPLSRCGMPQANSTTSMPARHFAARVRQHLAVLARDDARQLIDVRIEQRLEPEHHARALQRRRRRPCRQRGARRTDRRARFICGREADLSRRSGPVAGL